MTCADTNLNPDPVISPPFNREKFLSNQKNKSRLISFLKTEIGNFYDVLQASDDADVVIIHPVNEKKETVSKNIVAAVEDMDILI